MAEIEKARGPSWSRGVEIGQSDARQVQKSGGKERRKERRKEGKKEGKKEERKARRKVRGEGKERKGRQRTGRCSGNNNAIT